MSNAIRTEKTFKAVTFDELYKSEYQKPGTLTARVRQIVETLSYYPNMIPTNSKSDNLFSNDEFGEATEEQVFSSEENRVAFINVPLDATKEEIEKRLAALGVKPVFTRNSAPNPSLLLNRGEPSATVSQTLKPLQTVRLSGILREPPIMPGKIFPGK